MSTFTLNSRKSFNDNYKLFSSLVSGHIDAPQFPNCWKMVFSENKIMFFNLERSREEVVLSFDGEKTNLFVSGMFENKFVNSPVFVVDGFCLNDFSKLKSDV